MPNTSVSASAGPGNNVGSEASSTVRCERSTAGAPCEPLTRRGVERDALGGRIEKQLHRIVARLAVDVDRAGEPRGAIVGQPPIIGLPASRRGNQDHVAAAGMFEVVAAALRRRRAPRRCPAGREKHRPPGRPVAGRRRPRRRARTDDRPARRPGSARDRGARRRPNRGPPAGPPRGARGWDSVTGRPA